MDFSDHNFTSVVTVDFVQDGVVMLMMSTVFSLDVDLVFPNVDILLTFVKPNLGYFGIDPMFAVHFVGNVGFGMLVVLLNLSVELNYVVSHLIYYNDLMTNNHT